MYELYPAFHLLNNLELANPIAYHTRNKEPKRAISFMEKTGMSEITSKAAEKELTVFS